MAFGRHMGACATCGEGVSAAHRYCVRCGARVAPRDRLLIELLRRSRSAPDAGAPAPREASVGARMRSGLGALRSPSFSLPSPQICALLVLGFLGFGFLLGDLAPRGANDLRSAASRRQVDLVIPASAAEGSKTEGEPPPAAAEPTPQAGAALPERAPSAQSSRHSSSGSGAGAAVGSHHSSTHRGVGSNSSGSDLRAIKHVFVLMLSAQPYAATFGPSSSAPYLARTLERRGALLVRYYGVAQGELANEIAMLSGQGPTPQTAAGCPTYTDLLPGSAGDQGQVQGEGCVYPRATDSLLAQLARKHLTARSYVQGIDEAGAAAGPCAHPAAGAPDPTSSAAGASRGSYATFRNPFVYLHSITDSARCATQDVGLARLARDLADPAHTPAFSYIVPDRCHDGSSEPCAPGARAGLPVADELLRHVVPKVLASSAYKRGGLLVITVDQAPSSGEFADSSSCCGQPRFPNMPPVVSPGGAAVGGGQVGALLISPLVKGGTVSQEPYNHFSLLRTVEDVFGLSHIGYAALSKVTAFEASLFAAR